MSQPEWLRALLRCPGCRHDLREAPGPDGAPELVCAGTCTPDGRQRGYRIENGVPVLLIEQSRILEG